MASTPRAESPSCVADRRGAGSKRRPRTACHSVREIWCARALSSVRVEACAGSTVCTCSAGGVTILLAHRPSDFRRGRQLIQALEARHFWRFGRHVAFALFAPPACGLRILGAHLIELIGPSNRISPHAFVTGRARTDDLRELLGRRLVVLPACRRGRGRSHHGRSMSGRQARQASAGSAGRQATHRQTDSSRRAHARASERAQCVFVRLAAHSC